MKSNLGKNLLSVIFLFLILGCNSPTGGNETGTNNPENGSGNTLKNEDEIVLKLKSLWNENINSYDGKTQKLKITKRFDRATFDVSDVTTKGKYLVIEYENLSGFLTVETVYSDNSKNETSCYSKKPRDYILLDKNKKLKELNFVSMLDETMSVTIKKVYFAEKFNVGKDPVVDSKTNGSFDTEISSMNFVKAMGVGFNTGNFLEARTTGIESGVAFYDNIDVKKTWGVSDFTAEKFNLLKTAGGKSVRIPVSWANHIIDENYTIDPYWMEDVKSYVDLALSQGYYVIINDHSIRSGLSKPLAYHEGYITRNTAQDIEESERYIKAVWGQISKAFNNSYNEHLIFETLNEPRNQEEDAGKTNHNLGHIWSAGTDASKYCEECIADHRILNEYNQIILDTIRASGGNNAKRFVLVPSIGTAWRTALSNYFILPTDSATDKLIVTTHHYPLWNSLMDDYKKVEIKNTYSELNKKFVSKGIPVIIGEIGHTEKSDEEFNSEIQHEVTREEKLAPLLVLAQEAGKYGMCPMLFPANQTWEDISFAQEIIAAWEDGVSEAETEKAKEIKIENLCLDTSAESISFNEETNLLKITGQYKRASLDIQNVTKKGKYIIFEYADLCGSAVMDVVYSDDTRNTVYCTTDKTSVYIELEESKELKQLDFVAMDTTEVSLKLLKVYFANEV